MDERNQKSRRITKKVDFEIKISFDNSVSEEISLSKQIQYYKKTPKFDTVSIKNCEISIKGHRDTTKAFLSIKEWRQDEENCDLNQFYNSTLYDEIIESLAFYYLYTGDFSLKNIYIELNNETKFEFDKNDISLFSTSPTMIFSLRKFENADKVFEKKEYLNSALYLLQAKHEQNNFYAFERLWKSFNAIYRFYSGDKQDAQGLEKIAKFIKNNSEDFKESLELLKNEDINIFRWNSFIQNCVEQENLADVVESNYSSKEIRSVFEYRKDFIEKKKNELLKKLEKKLDKCSNNNDSSKDNTKKKEFLQKKIGNLKKMKIPPTLTSSKKPNTEVLNQEYIKLFLRYYIYFVRCSFFHGGKNDAKYNLFKVSRYDNELEFINKYLSCLICECLNAFEKLDPKNNKKGAK